MKLWKIIAVLAGLGVVALGIYLSNAIVITAGAAAIVLVLYKPDGRELTYLDGGLMDGEVSMPKLLHKDRNGNLTTRKPDETDRSFH